MTKLILSTANVMSAGPSIIRKPGNNRSNLELVNSLHDNFTEAKRDYAIHAPGTNGFTNGNAPNGKPAAVELWTERQGNALYVPRINWHAAGLREESSQYEITVKLFLLPGTSVASREQYAKEALDLVFEELHKQGLVKRLAVAEFGSEKLGAFIKRATIRPAIDQINLRNCCDVPPPLKKLAEEEGVELHVHNDCTDILPHGTMRELLGHGPRGAGLLADSANNAAGLAGEIVPEWVVRYTAFVQDRGVIENKGYFAGAELVEP
ncbi:hypothetical protein NM208_g13770 [Fusarium decemcellulare]|uniref:Uncharacterized protein n=1 Tax=Fusarium decemcellulare TaxID=57161 RepID=A0ACC1RK14_9HYPO|nr:hypothetical protein NM208_g13770 [Fusarium decemcellulare]